MQDIIGIDVSKDRLDAFRLSDRQHDCFGNDKAGFRALLKWIGDAKGLRIVYEPTGPYYEPTGPYHRGMEEALARAGHALVKVNPRQVARNVGGERVMFVRLIPRAIKDAYLGHLKRTIGDRSYSGVVSNLGRFLLPDEAKPFVASVGFALGPNIAYKTGCSVVSFDHDLYVTFGSVIHNRAVERSVFRRFAADGINVIVSEQTP
ncbi:MAG: hypothetical protein ACOC1I_02955 [Spirochaetota bacterium]